MRNSVIEEAPLLNIERNPLILVLFTLTSGMIVFFGYQLLKDVNPWGFMVMIPGAALTFQTLWLMLNPFALIFKDKIEIKQSFLHNKFRYFVDIKKVSQARDGKIYITYNDDEVELLNLFGVKTSQIEVLKNEMEKYVSGNFGTVG